MPSDLNTKAIENLIEVQAANFVSTNNSFFTSSLAADAILQGVGEDVSKYGRAAVAIHSDNATDGTLTMEVSHDGVTYFGPSRDWANTNIAVPHTWNIIEKFFRIKYVNGTTAATNLSIQVQYSNNADVILAHQLNETLAAETEAIITRPGNTFDLDTARKHVTGQRSFFFFGFNQNIGTSWVDIHPAGGNITWLTTASKIEVLSSDAADTSAGAGVRQVELHGLSATGEDQDEIITMNGTTAVESSLTYIRVNKLHNENVGTYGGSHKGDVTCRVTGAGDALSKMTGEEGSVDTSVQYGSGEAGNGYWSVPLGKVLYITRIGVIPNVKSNQTVNIVLFEREGILNTTAPYDPRRLLWSAIEFDGPIGKVFKSHIKIKQLTDIWFRAKGSGTNNKIEVSLDFYLVNADASGA